MPNTANCGSAGVGLTAVGSYPNSPSPNGTFDQGGNASEWTDAEAGILENRTIRGGCIGTPADRLRGAILEYDDPWFESGGLGFRVATLAEGQGGSCCGNLICESTEDPVSCPNDCPEICGDGLCSGIEDALSCSGDAGTLACNASTCTYNTSGCFDVSCKPRFSRCTQGSECCSGDCRFRRCR